MLVAEASVVTSANAGAVWRLWEDVGGWQTWDDGIEWCRLDGAFQAGSTGALKPKGGPRVRFTLLEVEPGHGFRDRSHLPLASLDFTHTLEPVEGGVRITHRVEARGPLGWLFGRLMGAGMRAGLPATVRALAACAEGRAAA
jgi:hypothetical protein